MYLALKTEEVVDRIAFCRAVAEGYNRIAESYLAARGTADPELVLALDQLGSMLPDGEPVADLGCGAGMSATVLLARRYTVTGIDISARQLELARRNVPNARFIQADMSQISFPTSALAAVTAFYSIVHVPRERQPALLSSILRWLKPGGLFLANWPATPWEGEDPDWEGWGSRMVFSHFGQDEYERLLDEAGFRILNSQSYQHQGEPFRWTLCQRPA